MMRYFAWTSCVIGIALTLAIGCVRHRSGGAPTFTTIPAGLDSAGREQWIAQQRAKCAGQFALLFDITAFAVQCTPKRDTTTNR